MKSYLSVLSAPGAWRFLLPALLARLPFAMLQLGTLYLVQWATGSYGWGGIAAAAAAVAQALVGPQTGRLADRFGQARVLVPQVIAHAVLLGGLLVLASLKAPAFVLIIMACFAGGTLPQVGSMVRARWADLMSGKDDRISTAFAIEAITDEIVFIAGPVLLIFVATHSSPVWALGVALVLVLAGTLGFAAVKNGAPEPIPVKTSGRKGVLRLRGVAVLCLAFIAIGSTFGSMQLGITSFAAAHGSPGAAGTIYGTFSVGSLIGGLLYGALKWKTALSRRLALILVMLAGATIVPSLVGSIGLLYAASALAGFVIAPGVIAGYTIVKELVAPEVRTETFTWLNGSIGVGFATGAAVSGQLVDHVGPSAAFLVPPITTALAAILVFARSRSLAPNPDARVTPEEIAVPA